MNSYFHLQKINFVNTGNNNYTCYLLYKFTGYRKLLTFDLQLSDGQIVHVYIDASNNSIQISNNPLNISLLPHIFYLKLQRINNNIKILEVQNADYITNSVIVYENNIYSLLDNIYMLSSLLLENKQDIENLEIAFKSDLNNVLITINNILSRLLNVESISSQQSNQINNHTNTIFSLLDNIYMLSSLLLENKQDIENLEFALRDALINAFNVINNIFSRLLNIEQKISIQRNIQVKIITGNYSITENDEYLICDNSTNITLTLPIISQTARKKVITIKKINTGNVTIQTSNNQLIDRSVTSFTLIDNGQFIRLLPVNETIGWVIV